jgi:predicted transposase/invertase (TIGR01784 family)
MPRKIRELKAEINFDQSGRKSRCGQESKSFRISRKNAGLQIFRLTEWQQTRFYQEIEEETKLKTELETKLKTIPRLLSEGLTVEQIARIFELDIEVVKTCNQTAK